jgi:hypothetical protein
MVKRKYVRFNESGEFHTQADVDKMGRVAELLEKRGVKSYTYTARSDLDYRQIPKALSINRSGWRGGKMNPLMNEFVAVYEIPPDAKYVCPGTASKKCGTSCFHCFHGSGKTIYIKLHGGGKK